MPLRGGSSVQEAERRQQLVELASPESPGLPQDDGTGARGPSPPRSGGYTPEPTGRFSHALTVISTAEIFPNEDALGSAIPNLARTAGSASRGCEQLDQILNRSDQDLNTQGELRRTL